MEYGHHVKRLGPRRRAMAALGHSGGVGRPRGDDGSDEMAEKPSDQNYERLLTFAKLTFFGFYCENVISPDALAWEGWVIDALTKHVLGDAGEALFAKN